MMHTYGPSTKQLDFIATLLTQRIVSNEERTEITAVLPNVDSREASAIIGRLLSYDFKPRNLNDTITDDGMYRTPDGVIYKVQFNKASGDGRRMYAKRLVVTPECDVYKVSFEYAPGATRFLTPSMRMTLEQAKEFGALYGTCCVCGRTLTNEVSIEAGIGPICAGKV